MNGGRTTPSKARRGAGRQSASGRPGGASTGKQPVSARAELEAAVSTAVRRCAASVAENGDVLEGIGLETGDAGDLFADVDARDLRHRATRIRRLALHALMVSSELQFIAGQFEALANIRVTTSGWR